MGLGDVGGWRGVVVETRTLLVILVPSCEIKIYYFYAATTRRDGRRTPPRPTAQVRDTRRADVTRSEFRKKKKNYYTSASWSRSSSSAATENKKSVEGRIKKNPIIGGLISRRARSSSSSPNLFSSPYTPRTRVFIGHGIAGAKSPQEVVVPSRRLYFYII